MSSSLMSFLGACLAPLGRSCAALSKKNTLSPTSALPDTSTDWKASVGSPHPERACPVKDAHVRGREVGKS
eukprot:2796166-Alexandrium_andersonii.AAC.1